MSFQSQVCGAAIDCPAVNDYEYTLTSDADQPPGTGGIMVPVNLTVPVITGTAQVGYLLLGSHGTWTNSPTGYAYRWLANGTAIGGATASSFLLTATQVGALITFEVTASNAGGNSAPETSPATIAVSAVVKPPQKATILGPANGVVGVSITPTLSWANGGGATGYDVWFGPANVGLTQIGFNQGATSRNVGTLVNGIQYKWRIDSINTGGTTTGVAWSFTTIPLPPDPAIPISPANNLVDVSITPTLSWSSAARATYYDVYVNGALRATVASNVTSYTIPSASKLGYFSVTSWRVDAKNANPTITTGATWSFRTIAGPPLKAALVLPGDGQPNIFIPGNGIQWANGGGATSYNVYLAGVEVLTGAPASVVRYNYSYGGNPSIVGDTTYTWRVDSINSTGLTTGDTWSFTTAHY